MARRYDSKEAKRRILTACVRLFLEKGYTNTKVAEILKEADVSAGSFQNIFRTKDGVLTELIGMMFSRQFGAVRPLAANAPSPVYLYAVETALQLAMTELSENLRDIYVEAYTFPATAEIIHRSTTAELQAAFSAFMPRPLQPPAPGIRMTAGVTLDAYFSICACSASAYVSVT